MNTERLRKARESLEFTQDVLAEKLGVEPLQIWRWESGRNKPSVDIVIKLAEALNVTSDYLLGITDEPTPAVMSHLSAKERAAIAAWRRGERLEAVKVIVADE